MAEKEKLSQEQKLQAVLYCLEHQLDYAGRDTPKEEALCHVGTAHYR